MECIPNYTVDISIIKNRARIETYKIKSVFKIQIHDFFSGFYVFFFSTGSSDPLEYQTYTSKPTYPRCYEIVCDFELATLAVVSPVGTGLSLSLRKRKFRPCSMRKKKYISYIKKPNIPTARYRNTTRIAHDAAV